MSVGVRSVCQLNINFHANIDKYEVAVLPCYWWCATSNAPVNNHKLLWLRYIREYEKYKLYSISKCTSNPVSARSPMLYGVLRVGTASTINYMHTSKVPYPLQKWMLKYAQVECTRNSNSCGGENLHKHIS